MARGAKEKGHEVEWIDVYDLDMKPCIACMKCRPDGPCMLPEDGAHRAAEKIREADALLVGTPTHWGNMSSQLKTLFDRCVPVFMGERPSGMPLPRQKGKQAVIVTACTTPWPFNVLAGQSRRAVRAVKEVLRSGGYRNVATIVSPGTKGRRGVPERVLRRAGKTGQNLSTDVTDFHG